MQVKDTQRRWEHRLKLNPWLEGELNYLFNIFRKSCQINHSVFSIGLSENIFFKIKTGKVPKANSDFRTQT
jgi:hypothetical protein